MASIASSTSVIEVKDAHKRYGESANYALGGIDFAVAPGECVGVVGESGSGKSTLARTLLGIEQLDAGEVRWFGKNIGAVKRGELRAMRQRMHMVYQHPGASFNPKLTIRDSLLEPLKLLKIIPAGVDMQTVAGELMQKVDLPSTLLDRYPTELSGGQLQRVAIARAISVQPDVVVLDEPTASLDVTTQASVLELLGNIAQTQGCAFVCISHDLAAVQQIADRIVVMRKGKIVDDFAAQDIFSTERDAYTKSLVELFT